MPFTRSLLLQGILSLLIIAIALLWVLTPYGQYPFTWIVGGVLLFGCGVGFLAIYRNKKGAHGSMKRGEKHE